MHSFLEAIEVVQTSGTKIDNGSQLSVRVPQKVYSRKRLFQSIDVDEQPSSLVEISEHSYDEPSTSGYQEPVKVSCKTVGEFNYIIYQLTIIYFSDVN